YSRAYEPSAPRTEARRRDSEPGRKSEKAAPGRAERGRAESAPAEARPAEAPPAEARPPEARPPEARPEPRRAEARRGESRRGESRRDSRSADSRDDRSGPRRGRRGRGAGGGRERDDRRERSERSERDRDDDRDDERSEHPSRHEPAPLTAFEDAPEPEAGWGGEFAKFPISKRLLRALDEIDFKTPTEIQSRVIPIALSGRDVVGQARTGTGKTAAFAIPILDRLARNPRSGARTPI